MDREFGFMYIRVQGWIPYDAQVYINGREWLARRLDEAGIGYVRYDNSLLKVDDLEAASRLCEEFAHRAWPRVLNAIADAIEAVRAIERRWARTPPGESIRLSWPLDRSSLA